MRYSRLGLKIFLFLYFIFSDNLVFLLSCKFFTNRRFLVCSWKLPHSQKMGVKIRPWGNDCISNSQLSQTPSLSNWILWPECVRKKWEKARKATQNRCVHLCHSAREICEIMYPSSLRPPNEDWSPTGESCSENGIWGRENSLYTLWKIGPCSKEL